MGKAIIKSLFRLVLAATLLATGMETRAGVPEGVEAYRNRDYKLAVKQFVPPAENGDAVALFYIALMYENAEGLPENFPQAMLLYRRAADMGYAPAQNNLGVMFETKAGTERSYKDAAIWYRKAAAQGNAPAQFNLGLMYYIGRGSDVPRSFKEAAAWYLKAAEQGYAPAQNSLARMYEYGQGMPVSLMQAYMWYSLASETGNEAFKANRQAIEVKLAPDMLEQAKAMAREWRASHQ